MIKRKSFMTTSTAPNIFEYATGELSQDAFICWLLAWIKCSPESPEADAAREFIVTLYNKYRDENLLPNAVESVMIVPQKKYNIDIYLEVKFKNETELVPFIIEDKVWTSPHSGQLETYREKVRKEWTKSKGVDVGRWKGPICIFFKTGYLFHDEDEKKATAEGYCIINAKWIVDLLEKHNSRHPFYLDYISYLTNKFVVPFDRARNEVLSESGHEELKMYGYKQYILMGELTKGMERLIHGKWNRNVSPGNNVGGTPWTQYRFFQLENIYGNKNESLFYRIDYRSKGREKRRSPYLRISHYANYGKIPEMKAFKSRRRKEYASLFDQAFEGSLKKGEISNRDGYESEVAIFFLDEPENSIPKLVESIPDIHKKFISLLKKSELTNNQ
jgi:hypothetical protein